MSLNQSLKFQPYVALHNASFEYESSDALIVKYSCYIVWVLSPNNSSPSHYKLTLYLRKFWSVGLGLLLCYQHVLDSTK